MMMTKNVAIVLMVIGMLTVALELGFIAGDIKALTSSLDTELVATQLRSNANAVIKVALYDGPNSREVKEVAGTLTYYDTSDHSGAYKLASSPETRDITIGSVKKVRKVLDSEDIHAELLTGTYTKCEGWLKTAAPGAGEFDASNSDITQKFTETLGEDDVWSAFDPPQLAIYLKDNSDALASLCRPDECLNAWRCAACGTLVLDYRTARRENNLATAEDLEEDLLSPEEAEKLDCPSACAQLCDTVHPQISDIMLPQQVGSLTGIDPGVRKDFIQEGLTLS